MAIEINEHEITSKEYLLAKVEFFADKLGTDLNTTLQLMILEELKQLNEFTEQNGQFLYEINDK
jgi:hypothetical protein